MYDETPSEAVRLPTGPKVQLSVVLAPCVTCVNSQIES